MEVQPPADTFGELIPAIGYIRVSTWKEEKISPELQRTSIEDWAKRTRRRIVQWVIDLDATGTNFHRKIMKAIAAIEGGIAKEIAVWKFSRFGRSRHGVAINLTRVEKVGGQLYSATEDADPRTATGRFTRGVLFEVAAFEADRIGEQWKEAHDYRRNAQLPAMGKPRFGYIWHKRYDPETGALQQERYEIDPELRDVVVELYARYLNGTGFKPLAVWLNSLGCTTTRGGLWGQGGIRYYMDSGFAAGLLRVHREDCPRGKHQGQCSYYRLVPGAHEAIISDETWKEYQTRRKAVAATPPRSRLPSTEVTGLTRCGQCSGAATVARSRNKPGFRCARRTEYGDAGCVGVWARGADVVAEVRKWLRRVAHEIDNAPSTPLDSNGRNDDRARAARERARAQAEHAKIEASLTRLAVDAAKNPDKYPQGVFEAARDELVAERDQLSERISALVEVEEMPEAEDYLPLVVGVLDEWETLTVAERNLILRKLIGRIALQQPKRPGPVTVEIIPVWKEARKLDQGRYAAMA
ncbi:recombinase family protein [Streptomyces sp. 769]|uniref:recombinase family protein n=1 Tax=Streptomyces sp. 769 TaxID=1262452 RepID=UPI0005821EC9|nr:recombinase family protein [Streptomyces sp. 769]AJC60193.1 resolvase C N domain protein [Streptomyces sp. 769]